MVTEPGADLAVPAVLTIPGPPSTGLPMTGPVPRRTRAQLIGWTVACLLLPVAVLAAIAVLVVMAGSAGATGGCGGG